MQLHLCLCVGPGEQLHHDLDPEGAVYLPVLRPGDDHHRLQEGEQGSQGGQEESGGVRREREI